MLQELGLDLETTHAKAGYGDGLHFRDLTTAAAVEMDRILLFMRDPRDTAVSGFYWFRTNVDQSYQGTLAEFIRDPRYGIEKIARFNLMWSELKRDDMMVLTYEQLHSDAATNIANVLSFFDIDSSRDDILRAISHNTFTEMQKRELAKISKRLAKTGGGAPNPSGLKARSGIVGNHKVEFSQEDHAFAESVLGSLDYFRRIAPSMMEH